jgi:glycosyltransferase involved in cell wall biosynthesis
VPMKNRSLRVLHVLGELRPSGAEVMLATAAGVFEAHGISGEVLSTGHDVGPYADRLAAAGYRIHHIPFSKTFGFFWRLWRLSWNRYDAIHIHTERAGFWIGLTALCARAGVVLRSHHSSFDFDGYLRVRRALQRHVHTWLGIRHVSIGESVRETEMQHFRLRTTLIRNWFDGSRFTVPSDAARVVARSALELEPDRFVIATIANCSDIKNHPELIRALALIPPSERPVYLHAGAEEPGSPERELARSLGLTEDIRFLGPSDDVRKVLYAADGFVMSSLKEGMSIAALEAIACGLPAVLTDVSGLKDFRLHFEGLIYCEPRADSLAAGIRKLCSMPIAERRRAGSANAEAARREYSLEAGAKAYVAMYRGEPAPVERSAKLPSGTP